MLDANRLLHAILDQMLELAPSDPAAVKSLADLNDGGLTEGELAGDGAEAHESVVPSSGVVAKSGVAEKLRAAS